MRENKLDGLKYHNEHLYFIINGGQDRAIHGLYKLKLEKNTSELGTPEPILLDHEKMNLPTTFSIVNDELYILANSQLENLNQETNQIIEPEDLTNTFILKLNIADGE